MPTKKSSEAQSSKSDNKLKAWIKDFCFVALLPLVPIVFEYLVSNFTVSLPTISLSACMYALTIAVWVDDMAYFGFAVFIGLIGAMCFGLVTALERFGAEVLKILVQQTGGNNEIQDNSELVTQVKNSFDLEPIRIVCTVIIVIILTSFIFISIKKHFLDPLKVNTNAA